MLFHQLKLVALNTLKISRKLINLCDDLVFALNPVRSHWLCPTRTTADRN